MGPIGHDRGCVRTRPHRTALATTAVALLAPALLALTAGRATAARVVWLHADRAYVALDDTGHVAAGMRAIVLEQGRERATGTVTDVLDGALAGVRLDPPLPALDPGHVALDVRFESAPRVRVGTLRVGLPAGVRDALAPRCAGVRIAFASLPRTYRCDTLAVSAFRLLATGAEASEWPDTLFVRTFSDRADEEIALERGELDAALFWPGEASARLRSGAFAAGAVRAHRAQGLVVADAVTPGAGGPPETSDDLAALAREMFGGDLEPSRTTGADPVPTGAPPARWSVDASLPGHRVVALFLNRRAGVRGSAGGVARLAWLDAALPDSAGAAAWLAAWRPVCPIFVAPARASEVQRLGGDAFADLADCRPARRR